MLRIVYNLYSKIESILAHKIEDHWIVFGCILMRFFPLSRNLRIDYRVISNVFKEIFKISYFLQQMNSPKWMVWYELDDFSVRDEDELWLWDAFCEMI